jgi:fermentation-respiration switch protein FrsA (DUF1100 family)
LLNLAGGLYLVDFALVRPETTVRENTSFGARWMSSHVHDTLTIRRVDGLKLTGYYFPASNASSKKLAILVHGYQSSVEHIAEAAPVYYDEGYHVFMADNRAHGASEGKYIGMGVLDSRDYVQWIDTLLRQNDSLEIVLHGQSMGGATVLMMSGRADLPPQVRCVVDDCGYNSVFDEFAYQLHQMFGLPPFPLLYVASWESKWLAGYAFDEGDVTAQVRQARVPILFIHGDADDYNPTWMVYELYDAAPTEKELWIVPGAKHAKNHIVAPEEFSARIRRFCARYVD